MSAMNGIGFFLLGLGSMGLSWLSVRIILGWMLKKQIFDFTAV